MNFAPNRDWELYRSLVSQHDVDPKRRPEERLQVYADFFNTIVQLRVCQPRSRFDRSRWEDKLAVRRKTLVALLALDEWNREGNVTSRSS